MGGVSAEVAINKGGFDGLTELLSLGGGDCLGMMGNYTH